MRKDRHFLLIPGFMCDASLWQFLLPALQQRGHVQLADLNQGDSIESMAERIQATTPEHAIVIGFSLGGYVARHLAWRLSTQVESANLSGLVLLNTSARASTEDELRRNQQQVRMLATYPYKGQTMIALRRALHPQRQDDTAMLAHLQTMSVALGKEVFLRQLGIQRADGHHELPRIRCPSLVVASRNDQMRSLEESEKLAQGLVHPELQIIEDCGHMSPLEKAPELIVLLDQWLKQNGL